VKRPVRTAAEQGVVSRWRHVLAYLGRPGVASGIKRQIRRRERRAGKQAAERND